MKPIYTIVNGAAGGGRCRPRADAALRRLREGGAQLEVAFTNGPGHATELAEEARAAGYGHFLSVGGDGTAFEVVNGLFGGRNTTGNGEPCCLSMLPLGTGNSFVRDFGVISEDSAIEAVLHGEEHLCDVIKAEHTGGILYYINLLSVGFSAKAGALTNKKFKKLGAGGYALSVLVSLARLEKPVIPIRIDGASEPDTRPSVLLSFSNSRYTGGMMMIAPAADVTDGQLDVVRVGPLDRRRFLAAFPTIFRGTHVLLPGIEQTRARVIEFADECERDVMIDGEIRRLVLKRIEVVPSALRVLA